MNILDNHYWNYVSCLFYISRFNKLFRKHKPDIKNKSSGFYEIKYLLMF